MTDALAWAANRPAVRGARIGAIGASITAANGARPGNDLSVNGMLAWAALLSQGQLKYAGHFGVGGVNAQYTRDICLPGLLALPGARPHYCIVDASTNNMADLDNLEACKTAVQQTCARLRAAGIEPILISVPPRNGATAQVYANISHFNTWLVRRAELDRLAYVDSHTNLVDPTTGGYAAGILLAGDGSGLHYSPDGAKLVGQAIVDALAGRNPAWAPRLRDVDTDTFDLIAGGCFVTDTNADGLADGFSVYANGAVAVLSRVADAAIKGFWQQIAQPASASSCTIGSAAPFALTPGHRVRWSGRMEVITPTVGAIVNLYIGGAALATIGQTGNEATFIGWNVTAVRGVFDLDFIVPPGVTIGFLVLTTAGAAITVKMAQQSLVDLDAIGAAT